MVGTRHNHHNLSGAANSNIPISFIYSIVLGKAVEDHLVKNKLQTEEQEAKQYPHEE